MPLGSVTRPGHWMVQPSLFPVHVHSTLIIAKSSAVGTRGHGISSLMEHCVAHMRVSISVLEIDLTARRAHGHLLITIHRISLPLRHCKRWAGVGGISVARTRIVRRQWNHSCVAISGHRGGGVRHAFSSVGKSRRYWAPIEVGGRRGHIWLPVISVHRRCWIHPLSVPLISHSTLVIAARPATHALSPAALLRRGDLTGSNWSGGFRRLPLNLNHRLRVFASVWSALWRRFLLFWLLADVHAWFFPALDSGHNLWFWDAVSCETK